jgi:23S rRNA U2552 (ribose-2'-O)-methylase RlmE/FtsJ
MEQFLKVDGIIAAQTHKIENVFKPILNEFDLIVEIGFDRGAFSLWLYKNKNEDAKLVSYDISFNGKEVECDKIDFRQGDCFDMTIVNEITELINHSKKALILCDGGAKEREFALYSKILRSGDVIMLHDYAHDHNDYVKICTDLGWNTAAESNFENIQVAIKTNNLVPYNYDAFKAVLWGSFIKQ